MKKNQTNNYSIKNNLFSFLFIKYKYINIFYYVIKLIIEIPIFKLIINYTKSFNFSPKMFQLFTYLGEGKCTHVAWGGKLFSPFKGKFILTYYCYISIVSKNKYIYIIYFNYYYNLRNSFSMWTYY